MLIGWGLCYPPNKHYLYLHAASLWTNYPAELNDNIIQKLRDILIYFVCGDVDGNLSFNQEAYQLLEEAGNEDIEFVFFSGGHEVNDEQVEGMHNWLKQFTNDYSSLSVLSNSTANALEIKLTPNPACDRFTIDYQGKVLWRKQLHKSASFPTPDTPGVYLLRICTPDKESVNKISVHK